MDIVSVVQVDPYLYYVFGTHNNIQQGGTNKPDAYTMDGNTLLWVTQNVCVSHGHILLQ